MELDPFYMNRAENEYAYSDQIMAVVATPIFNIETNLYFKEKDKLFRNLELYCNFWNNIQCIYLNHDQNKSCIDMHQETRPKPKTSSIWKQIKQTAFAFIGS